MGILSRVLGDKDWRDDLDQDLVNKLEKLLQRTKSYESAYKNAGKPAVAQLWVGMADMLMRMEQLEGRMRRIEHRQAKLFDAAEDAGVADEDLRESLDNY